MLGHGVEVNFGSMSKKLSTTVLAQSLSFHKAVVDAEKRNNIEFGSKIRVNFNTPSVKLQFVDQSLSNFTHKLLMMRGAILWFWVMRSKVNVNFGTPVKPCRYVFAQYKLHVQVVNVERVNSIDFGSRGSKVRVISHSSCWCWEEKQYWIWVQDQGQL